MAHLESSFGQSVDVTNLIGRTASSGKAHLCNQIATKAPTCQSNKFVFWFAENQFSRSYAVRINSHFGRSLIVQYHLLCVPLHVGPKE